MWCDTAHQFIWSNVLSWSCLFSLAWPSFIMNLPLQASLSILLVMVSIKKPYEVDVSQHCPALQLIFSCWVGWISWLAYWVGWIRCLPLFGFLRPDLSHLGYRNRCFLVALCQRTARRPNLELATKTFLQKYRGSFSAM